MSTQRIKTPCVGLCSTVYGDLVCRGCKRFHHEVVNWNAYSDEEKRAVWRRITAQAPAWRFGRYAERASHGHTAHPQRRG